jgi:hypothetical protein
MIDKSTMYTAEEFDAELRRNDDSIGFMKMITTAFRSAFHEDFTQYSAHFQTLKPDVLMCDHLNDPCIRAAEKYEIPLILTSTMAVYDGKKYSMHFVTTSIVIYIWLWNRCRSSIYKQSTSSRANNTVSINLDKILLQVYIQN